MTIKKIEDLKKRQIICRNQKQVKDCFKYLEQLGFKIHSAISNSLNLIIKYDVDCNNFRRSGILYCGIKVEFYNKNFVKTLQKFIKEKQKKEKEKIEDFEVASDGRIIKINNWESEKCLYFIGAWDYGTINFDDFKREGFEYYIKLGLVFSTAEARDKAQFKMEIETKLKNIAERLNAGRKIDWKNELQEKFYLLYNHQSKTLDWFGWGGYCQKPGAIYCLDKNFLEVAKQEIGEQNLIKYFTGLYEDKIKN